MSAEGFSNAATVVSDLLLPRAVCAASALSVLPLGCLLRWCLSVAWGLAIVAKGLGFGVGVCIWGVWLACGRPASVCAPMQNSGAMLERRTTLNLGAERRAHQLSAAGAGGPGPLNARPLDVDSLLRSGASSRRSTPATLPQPVQFPLRSFNTGDSQTIFKADTFTCSTEDFLTSDTTYVAQLREELWQALASHVAHRTLQKVDAALNCLEEVRHAEKMRQRQIGPGLHRQ